MFRCLCIVMSLTYVGELFAIKQGQPEGNRVIDIYDLSTPRPLSCGRSDFYNKWVFSMKKLLFVLPVILLCACERPIQDETKLLYERDYNNCMWSMTYALANYAAAFRSNGITTQAYCEELIRKKINAMPESEIRRLADLIRQDKYTKCDMTNPDLERGCVMGIENI